MAANTLIATTPLLGSSPKALRSGPPRFPVTIVYGIDRGGSRAKNSERLHRSHVAEQVDGRTRPPELPPEPQHGQGRAAHAVDE